MIHYHHYLPMSEEVHRSSLYVSAAGYSVGQQDVSEPHKRARLNASWPPCHPPSHDFQWSDGRVLCEYQIIYITRGSGLFESATCGLRRLEAGDLFALFPGEWHRYGPTAPEIVGNTLWDTYWIAFVGRLAAEYVAECRLSVAEPILKVGADPRLVAEFLCITDEMRELAAGSEKIMASRALLILALAEAAHLRRSDHSSEVFRLMERAKGLMLERVDQAPDLQVLAADLGMSYSWFRKMFRQHMGVSPAQYHLQYRIGRACDLLRSSNLPTAAIGESLGFESAPYFCDIFKKKVGCSPRDYRARAQILGVPETEPALRK